MHMLLCLEAWIHVTVMFRKSWRWHSRGFGSFSLWIHGRWRHDVALRCICFDEKVYKHVHVTTKTMIFNMMCMISSCRFWGSWLTRVLIILDYERKDFVTMSVGPLHDNCRSTCSDVTWLMRNPRCCRKKAMCMYMVEVLVCYLGSVIQWTVSASIVSKGSWHVFSKCWQEQTVHRWVQAWCFFAHLSVQSHLCFVSLYSLTFVYLTAEH